MQQNNPPHEEPRSRASAASRRTHPARAGRLVALVVLFSALAAAALAADPRFPPLTGRVVDQAGILSPSTEQHLTALLEQHERKTSNQVVVATLASLEGYDIADYGVRLGRAWGISQRGRDNGVILIVAPRERLVRIEVGYGLEGALPDARASAIVHQEILPRFRVGDMEGGVVQGTLAILGSIEGTYAPKPAAPGPPVDATIVPILMIVLFFVLIGMFGRYNGRRRGGAWGAPVFIPGGWGGRGGGGGGGFRGGGGSFGGGGASGRW